MFFEVDREVLLFRENFNYNEVVKQVIEGKELYLGKKQDLYKLVIDVFKLGFDEC